LAPGLHTLADPNSAGAPLQFTVNPDGTVGYDSSLEGVLMGAGTSELSVVGVAVHIQVGALSQVGISTISVDGQSYPILQLPPTITLLPGPFVIQYPTMSVTTVGQSITLNLTVSASDQVDFDTSLDNLVELLNPNTVFLRPPP
jgi:hypothetical protein